MFVPLWLFFLGTGTLMAIVTLVWAMRTNQLEDQDRARFLPLAAMSAEELAAMSAEELPAMSAEELAAMSAEELAAMSAEEPAALAPLAAARRTLQRASRLGIYAVLLCGGVVLLATAVVVLHNI